MKYPWANLKRGEERFIPNAKANTARTACVAWFARRGRKVMIVARTTQGGATLHRVK